MKRIKTVLFIAFVIVATRTWATTWNEPWQETVIKEADYFVYAKIISYDPQKGVKIEILKLLIEN